MSLKNKKIVLSLQRLLIGNKEEILEKMREYFLEVKYVYGSDKSKEDESIIDKIYKELNRKKKLRKYFLSKIEKRKEIYWNKLIENFKDVDYLLMIGRSYYETEFLKNVKKLNPKIKLILFLWDTYDIVNINKLKNVYNKIYTFEKEEAMKYDLKWRPSFFLKVEENKKEIDCYYLGTMKEGERYNYIDQLYNYCVKNNLNYFLKLYLKKINKIYNKNIMTNKKISYKENLEKVKKSKVILELNAKNQNGLTLRTLECLAYGTKLITTNQNIRNYDFYNKNNIYILNKPEDIDDIPLEFFKKDYEKINKEILRKYSFEGFIEEIFEDEK